MIKLIILLCFLYPFSLMAQLKPDPEIRDRWDYVEYARDIAKVYSEQAKNEAKHYFISKVSEFKSYCDNDSILVMISFGAVPASVIARAPVTGNPSVFYRYVKPKPTFEQFIIWLDKNK